MPWSLPASLSNRSRTYRYHSSGLSTQQHLQIKTTTESQDLAIEPSALRTLHEVTVAATRSRNNAEIWLAKGINSSAPMDVVGIPVHVVVGIHGPSSNHRTSHCTSNSVHSHVCRLVGWDRIHAGIPITGLLRHGSPVIVHHLGAACVAIWQASSPSSVHHTRWGTPARIGHVGVPTHAGSTPSGCNWSGDRRRGRAAPHIPASR